VSTFFNLLFICWSRHKTFTRDYKWYEIKHCHFTRRNSFL